MRYPFAQIYARVRRIASHQLNNTNLNMRTIYINIVVACVVFDGRFFDEYLICKLHSIMRMLCIFKYTYGRYASDIHLISHAVLLPGLALCTTYIKF